MQKSVVVKRDTNRQALSDDTRFCNDYVGSPSPRNPVAKSVAKSENTEVLLEMDDEEKYVKIEEDNIPGEKQFIAQVSSIVSKMEGVCIENKLADELCWEYKFSHVGVVYHAVQENEAMARKRRGEKMDCFCTCCSRFCKSFVCNVLKCRL